MKTCTEKERENCNCEKLGCKGCYYNENITEKELKINENIRNERRKDNV